MKIQFQNFQGMRPRTSPDKLPDNYAQVATDCDFRGGVLAPVKGVTDVRSIPKAGTLRTLYKHGDNFLAFPGEVDVIESPVEGTQNRFAWTDGVQASQSTEVKAFSGAESTWPTVTRELGVPYPASPLTVTLTGTASDTLLRTVSYTYTYVTDLEEESANAYPSGVFDVYDGQTVNLSGFIDPSDSDLVVTHYRIYRSESGTDSAELEYLGTANVGTTTWNDTITTPSGESLETTTWIPCPDDMQGLLLTSGGMAAGFLGKEIYLSEPWYMYAWPEGYRLVVDADIVGIGFSDSTIFVLTEDHPYILSGVSPETMTLTRVNYPQACLSKKSIVNIPGGCVYASPDGLVLLNGSGQASVITEQVYTKEQWSALNPSLMIGCYFDRKYYCFFSGTTSGLVFDLDNGSVSAINIGSPVYDAIYNSADDALYLLVYSSGYHVYSVGAGEDQSYTYQTRTCRSLVATNMACARLFGEQSTSKAVAFRLLCDGVLKHEVSVTSGEPFRLPSGFRTKEVSVEVAGKADITMIELATSVAELKA